MTSKGNRYRLFAATGTGSANSDSYLMLAA